MKYGNATLGQVEAVWNKLGGEEGVQQFLSGALVVVKATILKKIGTIKLPATSKFIAKEHFATDSSAVKIAWFGDSFKQWFLEKVEEPQAETKLCYGKLKESSLDVPILTELSNSAETTLASIWELLKKQPNGESGTLLINGMANIFYVCDTYGFLRVVGVGWYGGGWNVYAGLVEDSNRNEWERERRVFSRNS